MRRPGAVEMGLPSTIVECGRGAAGTVLIQKVEIDLSGYGRFDICGRFGDDSGCILPGKVAGTEN